MVNTLYRNIQRVAGLHRYEDLVQGEEDVSDLCNSVFHIGRFHHGCRLLDFCMSKAGLKASFKRPQEGSTAVVRSGESQKHYGELTKVCNPRAIRRRDWEVRRAGRWTLAA